MTPDQARAQAEQDLWKAINCLYIAVDDPTIVEHILKVAATALRAARGEAIRDAKAQALRYFGGYAATHRALNLGGFLDWCDKAAALDAGREQ